MSDVVIVECNEYTPSKVYSAAAAAVSLLGGIKVFVKPGQTVLLKPNLLQASAPQEAIITHPFLVGAVARLLKDCGAKVIIADSPGGPFARFRLQKIYQKAGLESIAKDTESVLNFNTAAVQIPNPGGELIKRFDLMSVALSADAIINLPKLKNHTFMRLTGATKNLFGLIPGMIKSGYHAKLVTADNFARMLLDLLFLVKPTLTVMDAVIGMEGDGPAAGRPKYIGALIASRDSIATDAAAAYIANIKAEEVPTLRLALERGINTANIKKVNILGKPLESVRTRDFRPPKGAGRDLSRIPAPIRQYLANSLVVPTEVRKADCNGCGDCYKMCPVAAITIKNGKASIDTKLCIRCYCCHEICPNKSIDLKPSILCRLLARH